MLSTFPTRGRSGPEDQVRPTLRRWITFTLPALALAASACDLSYDWQDPGPSDAAGHDARAQIGDARIGPDASIDAAVDAASLPPDATPAPDADLGCGTSCPPTGIVLDDPASTAQLGGTGGSGFAATCPSGQVIIGYDGALEPNFGAIGSLRAHCGALAISEGTLAVTVTATGTLARHGAVTSPAWTRLCPANTMLVGFAGHSGALVDQLSFVCAPLVVKGTPGSYSLGYGAQTTLSPIGDNGGSVFAAQLCADGRVGTGDAGRAGSFVDAYALTCRRPHLVF
jgi:hypothetical protein